MLQNRIWHHLLFVVIISDRKRPRSSAVLSKQRINCFPHTTMITVGIRALAFPVIFSLHMWLFPFVIQSVPPCIAQITGWSIGIKLPWLGLVGHRFYFRRIISTKRPWNGRFVDIMRALICIDRRAATNKLPTVSVRLTNMIVFVV